MSWLSLSDTCVDGHLLRLRFVPDMFMHEHETPVLEVTVEEAENTDDIISAIARFRDDFIVDIEVMPNELRILGEMDTEETIVSGGRLSSRYVKYSREELLSIARSFQNQLQEEQSYALQLSSRISHAQHFVSDLIDRAEKRKLLSSKTTAYVESQLAILHRVRNRLDDA